MRFPSFLGVVQLGMLFLFASDQLFVTANHRSRTAPGADDPDFGRGLSKEHETHEASHQAEYESTSVEFNVLRFRGEDPDFRAAALEYEGKTNDLQEGDNRRRLRGKSNRMS